MIGQMKGELSDEASGFDSVFSRFTGEEKKHVKNSENSRNSTRP